MYDLPTPVLSSIGIRKVTLRRFIHPYFEAFCNNCSWVSFTYAREDEAEDRADSHADRCCARLNEELANRVDTTPTAIEVVPPGAMLLLRDLRVMEVENIETFDDEVMLTYSIGGYEAQILMLPLGRIVKVLPEELVEAHHPACVEYGDDSRCTPCNR